MKNLKTFDEFLNESINEGFTNNFPKLEEFITSLIPKGKAIQLFIEDHRLLIGYYPSFASMADLSKSLPEKVNKSLEEKFAKSEFTLMKDFIKNDPISGKKMTFTVISAKDKKTLSKIEKLF